MAKAPEKEIEFHSDAMQRAVKVVAKSPPQHRVAKKQTTATQKRRAKKAKKKPGG
jgi:hypothetical protein